MISFCSGCAVLLRLLGRFCSQIIHVLLQLGDQFVESGFAHTALHDLTHILLDLLVQLVDDLLLALLAFDFGQLDLLLLQHLDLVVF